MRDEGVPRFGSAEGAVRFYFRAKALFANGEPVRHRSRRHRRWDVVDDYLSLAACLRRLDAVQVGLLNALYGPTSFGARTRTVEMARSMLQKQFDDVRLNSRSLGRLRRQSLRVVERALSARHLLNASAGHGTNSARRSARSAGPRESVRRHHR